MLGIVTEVTVKLIPKPQQARVIMASFDDVVKGGNAVANVIAAGIIPAGLEMMDQTSSRMVEPFVKAGYDVDAAAILLWESDGTVEEVEEEIARMRDVLNDSGATAITVSESEAERLRFWSGRKNAFPAAGRISPDYYCMDGTIPRKKLAQVLLGIAEMETKYGLRCANVFHAGDGNLHPLILFDANLADEFHRAELFGAEILELCVEVGGTITGEHGVPSTARCTCSVGRSNSLIYQGFNPWNRHWKYSGSAFSLPVKQRARCRSAGPVPKIGMVRRRKVKSWKRSPTVASSITSRLSW